MFLWKLIQWLLDAAWRIDRFRWHLRHWRFHLVVTIALIAAFVAIILANESQPSKILALIIVAAGLVWGWFWDESTPGQ